MSDNSISIPINERTVNKIRALSLLSGMTPVQVTHLFVNAFEEILDDRLHQAIGGASRHNPATLLEKQSVLEDRPVSEKSYPGGFGEDVSGFAEGVGALESDPEDVPEEPSPPANERAEVMDSLQEMDQQAAQPDDFIDNIQEEVQEGRLAPGDSFSDPDIDALENEASKVQDYGVDNITTEGGAADFFMSHVEGRRVRTGIKSAAQSRVKVSPAT